jgi:hypothetical protein
MNKIKPQDCVVGKWYYCEESKGRLLCVHTTEKAGLFIEDANSRGNVKKFVMSRIETLLMTPLPDCTGWDWVAPPKYRAFKDAWEFVEHAKRREIWKGGQRLDIPEIKLNHNHYLLYGKTDSMNHTCLFSGQDLLEQCTFADTNEPCGVKL